MKLLVKRQVPFYFKTNDKVAWISRENVNLAAIVRSSSGLAENDVSQGATKRTDIKLIFLDLSTGDVVKEMTYKLVFHCPVLELVCDLTTTSTYPLLNVFARLEDFQSRVFVFSCIHGEQLKKEGEIAVESYNRRGSNCRWGTSVGFINSSPILNDIYWLSVVLTEGDFMLFKMTLTQSKGKPLENFNVSCMGPIRSSKMDLNRAFSWRLLDFSPDQQHVAIIGRGAYVFYIGLVILDLESLKVIAEDQLKGFHSVSDAKYSAQGNFFLALCSGQRTTRNERGSVDFENCKSVVIWDQLGNVLHKIHFVLSSVSAMSCFEVFPSPHDNYIILPQAGLDSNGNQFSLFLKHAMDFSKSETQLQAEEILYFNHDRGTDNYTSCVISPSGHQLLVVHCCNTNVDDRNEDVSSLLVYRMNNSPAELKILCRVAVRNYYVVQNLQHSQVPKEILSFLNWS